MDHTVSLCLHARARPRCFVLLLNFTFEEAPVTPGPWHVLLPSTWSVPKDCPGGARVRVLVRRRPLNPHMHVNAVTKFRATEIMSIMGMMYACS